MPGKTAITVGYSQVGLEGRAPLLIAKDKGYFTAAGFDDVVLTQVQEPLPGLLNGDLDFGVVSVVDAADGFEAGLPLVAVSGYRNVPVGAASPTGSEAPASTSPDANPSPDASPGLEAVGPDLLAANSDLATNDPATVQAFQGAIIRALQVLADPANADYVAGLASANGITLTEGQLAEWPAQAASFAPYDGGFGRLDEGAGLAQLWATIEAGGLPVPDPATFIATDLLDAAQASLGLAANPDLALVAQPSGSPDAGESPAPAGQSLAP